MRDPNESGQGSALKIARWHRSAQAASPYRPSWSLIFRVPCVDYRTDNLQLLVRPTKIRVRRTKHTHKTGCSRSDGRATGRTRCISSKIASHYDDAPGRRQSGLGRKDLIRAGIGWRSAVEFVPTALTVGHREISQLTLLFRLHWEGGLVAAIRTTPVARLKG